MKVFQLKQILGIKVIDDETNIIFTEGIVTFTKDDKVLLQADEKFVFVPLETFKDVQMEFLVDDKNMIPPLFLRAENIVPKEMTVEEVKP